jgi:hypothetical protein
MQRLMLDMLNLGGNFKIANVSEQAAAASTEVEGSPVESARASPHAVKQWAGMWADTLIQHEQRYLDVLLFLSVIVFVIVFINCFKGC